MTIKRIAIILLCLIPTLAKAQEIQIVGGNIIDEEYYLEELDAAVITTAQNKQKLLDGKGMRIPGGVLCMTPENLEGEIGSLIKTKQPFNVNSISFTVLENQIADCKASLRIYRVEEEEQLVKIITMPIYQDIPKNNKRTTFYIVPEEKIVLMPGEYYICFSLSEADMSITDKIFFPLYLKNSYKRDNKDVTLDKWSANIGIEVRGN